MNKEQIELRGFLYADGCVTIIRQKRKRYYKDKTYHFVNYVPRVNITQRNDNLPLLLHIRKHYGGYVYENRSLRKASKEGYRSNPASYWQIQSFRECYRIAKIMLDTDVPYAKKKAVKILHDFCKWRSALGQRKFTEEEMKKIEDWHREMKLANSFNGVTQ